MRSVSIIAAAVIVAALTTWSRAEPPKSLMVGERLEAATELVFTEGPAYHESGAVYYTEIANNRIMRLNPGAADADVFLRPSGRANGLMFDATGRVIFFGLRNIFFIVGDVIDFH